MSVDSVELWAKNFCRDAKQDDLALLRDHLRRGGLPDEPEKLLIGTIMFVEACCAYLIIDCQPIEEFLAMQSYRPTVDADSHCSFTFNLFDKAYGRIITPFDKKDLDLVDLFGHMWYEFKLFGFSNFYVSRLDNRALSAAEITEIKEAITYDIRYDFDEDEVEILIDQNIIEGVLLVHMQDVTSEDDETDLF